MKMRNIVRYIIVTALAALSICAVACSPDYGPEIQSLRDQNAQTQEIADAHKARLEQLEKDIQEAAALAERIEELEQANGDVAILVERIEKIEQANGEVAILVERIEKLEQANQEIPVLAHRITQLEQIRQDEVDFTGSGFTLTYEEATDEERDFVREASECSANLLGDNINKILIDEMEKEMWRDFETGYWGSFGEFRLAMSLICNLDQ